MDCRKCGRRLPDNDPKLTKCPNCGAFLPKKKQSGWEFKKRDVDLHGISHGENPSEKEKKQFRDEFSSIVLTALDEEGWEEWEPVGGIDFGSLERAGAIYKEHKGAFGPFPAKWKYISVTVQLKRPRWVWA